MPISETFKDNIGDKISLYYTCIKHRKNHKYLENARTFARRLSELTAIEEGQELMDDIIKAMHQFHSNQTLFDVRDTEMPDVFYDICLTHDEKLIQEAIDIYSKFALQPYSDGLMAAINDQMNELYQKHCMEFDSYGR